MDLVIGTMINIDTSIMLWSIPNDLVNELVENNFLYYDNKWALVQVMDWLRIGHDELMLPSAFNSIRQATPTINTHKGFGGWGWSYFQESVECDILCSDTGKWINCFSSNERKSLPLIILDIFIICSQSLFNNSIQCVACLNLSPNQQWSVFHFFAEKRLHLHKGSAN